MQQIVVDIVHLQAFQRLLVHTLRVVEAPLTTVLVRHLGGNMVFISGIPAQRITRQHLRATAHIHRCRVEVVHTVSDGIVHQLVNILLTVRQTHHTEAQ